MEGGGGGFRWGVVPRRRQGGRTRSGRFRRGTPLTPWAHREVGTRGGNATHLGGTRDTWRDDSGRNAVGSERPPFPTAPGTHGVMTAEETS
uniref:Uncharacterized protein n=1 Tax=Arundo donax TaxID=35708 RepID=A0A0A9BQ23_ARUDO